MFQIILSSNSTLSKAFKLDVSKILTELRKNGDLIMTNNEIKLKKVPANQDDASNTFIVNCTKNTIVYSYDNHEDQILIQELIFNGSMLPLSKYINTPVIYNFIIPLRHTTKAVIIKIGYTDNIINRIETLKSEYKCNVYLIGIKAVRSEKTEKDFHNMLQNVYSKHVVPYEIKSKNKVELYELTDPILKQFDSLQEYITPTDNNIVTPSNEQLNIIQYIRNQHKIFLQSVATIYPQAVQFQSDDCLLKYHKSHFEYLTLKSNIQHMEIMKELDIQLKSKELDAQLKSKELDAQLKSKELDAQLKSKEQENERLRLTIELKKLSN
jgi:hypothetical protein